MLDQRVIYCDDPDEPGRDRIDVGHKDDWNCCCHIFDHLGRRRADSDYDIRELHQLARKPGKPLALVVGVSPLNDEVLAFDVAQLAQGFVSQFARIGSEVGRVPSLRMPRR